MSSTPGSKATKAKAATTTKVTPKAAPKKATPKKSGAAKATKATSPSTGGSTIAVVYNPIKVDLAEIKRVVKAESGSAGWTTLWLETSEEDPGGGQATEAVDAGASVVIAAGGDGTVRAVAEVLAGTDVALALLPSGTGNLLARNLELTLDDMEHSIGTAFGGTDRSIDVAEIDIFRPDGTKDTYTYLVMAGVGLDAKIMNNTDPELKKKVGWLAYASALSSVMRDKNALRVQSRTSRRRRPERAQAVIVGNCGSLPANILLLPDAVVDDGLLDVVVLKPESFIGWVQVIFKVFWENGIVKRTPIGRKMEGVAVRSVVMEQVAEFEVRLSRPDEIELDGDPFGATTGFAARVKPGALRVKVPVDE